MVTTMLAVVAFSQQSLVVNVPVLIAASPRPRSVAGWAYATAVSVTAVFALLYVLIGTRVATGLAYLRDPNLVVLFVAGSVRWSIFSLQDSVLTGLAKGRLVLLENSIWGAARLGIVALLPVAGVALGVGWLIAAWLIPAALLVVWISHVLFVAADSPMRRPLGEHAVDPRRLLSFLAVEHAAAMVGAAVALLIPAVALTRLGAAGAAPFLAAYSFMVVSENAMGSFAQAVAVDVRRSGGASASVVRLTVVLIALFSVGLIVGAHFFAVPFMSLFGHSYAAPGGAVLTILVLGLPARCIWMLATAGNRLTQAGWKNLAQSCVYAAATVVAIAASGARTARSLAVCLVVARLVAALTSFNSLRVAFSPHRAGREQRLAVIERHVEVVEIPTDLTSGRAGQAPDALGRTDLAMTEERQLRRITGHRLT